MKECEFCDRGETRHMRTALGVPLTIVRRCSLCEGTGLRSDAMEAGMSDRGMTGNVVWEEPPPVLANKRRVAMRTVLSQLRRSPGRWARIGEYKNHKSAHSSMLQFRQKWDGVCEFVVRDARLYARCRNGTVGADD